MKGKKSSNDEKYGFTPEEENSAGKEVRAKDVKPLKRPRVLEKVIWLIESGKYAFSTRKMRKEREARLAVEKTVAAGTDRDGLIIRYTEEPEVKTGEQDATVQGVNTDEQIIINDKAEPEQAIQPPPIEAGIELEKATATAGTAIQNRKSEGKNKKATSFHIGGWRYSVKKLVLVSLAILLAIGIGVAGQFSYIVFARPQAAFTQPTPIPQDINQSPDTDDQSVDDGEDYTDPGDPEEATPTPDPYAAVAAQAQPDFNKDIVNVLLIGADYAEERADWNRYNSDVMIILAMNFKENKVDMISVPRDTYAKIYKTPGHYKLNSSMYFGGEYEKNGPEYVMRSVETVLGDKIPINFYVGVDIPALKDLVDTLGGVDYNVDVRIDLNGRVIEPGMQHLDGQQVVDYCRARKGIDNDLGRVDRQKNILFTLFKKLRDTKSLAKLPDLVKAMEGKIHTNLSFEQICAMVLFGSGLSDDKIKMHTVPGDFHVIFNSKFVVLDQQAKVKLVQEIYGVTIKPDNAYGLSAAMREWETMMAKQYISKVQKVLDRDGNLPIEQQKISAGQRALLEGDIAETKAAVSSKNTSRISSKKEQLMADANTVTSACGLSRINWDVDQNPGKKNKY